jgi:hypothetical protein
LAFYPNDWLEDLELRLCSMAAQGLWINLMCVMDKGVPYGHLTFPEDLILSRINISREQYRELLAELETVRETGKSVAYRTEAGVLFSKRMVREEQKRVTNTANGIAGGNPALKKPVVPASSPMAIPNTAPGFDAEAGFKQLWDAYPAKGRVEIGLCRTYFCDEILNAETLAAALESITTGKWAKSEKWAKGFILAMPKWIHNRAWETEDPEPAGGDKPGGPTYRKWEPPKPCGE